MHASSSSLIQIAYARNGATRSNQRRALCPQPAHRERLVVTNKSDVYTAQQPDVCQHARATMVRVVDSLTALPKCHAMHDALPHARQRPRHMVESGKVAPCRAHVRRLKLYELRPDASSVPRPAASGNLRMLWALANEHPHSRVDRMERQRPMSPP